MLHHLDANCLYPEWRDIVWAVAASGLSNARSLARAWSSTGSEWNESKFNTLWDSYDNQRGSFIGFGTLIAKAKAAGFKGPSGYTDALLNNVYSDPPVGAPRFQLMDRNAIMALPPLRWRVKGLLPETGIAAIYGPSRSGKSFLSWDVGCAIAMGATWFGHRTIMGPVTYVMLEGEAALGNRAKAWEKHYRAQLPAGFRAMNMPFQISDPQQVEELGAILPQGGVVIIDTLNRAAPGLDENSSQDMGHILAGMKRLQEITSGLVVIVHHTGKDASKGLRGHSSLPAALDGAIEVERSANGRCWSAAKVKDGEDGKVVPFALHVIDLGADADGDPINSCAVGPDSGAIFCKPPPTGKRQKEALAAIRHALSASATLGQAGAGPQTTCLRMAEAIAEAANAVVGVDTNRRTPRAREAVQGLISGGHLQRGLDAEQDEWVWL